MIKDNSAPTSLLVDYNYLSREHGIDIPNNEILDEFVRGLANILPLKDLVVDEFGKKLYSKITSEGGITLTDCHVFYETNQEFNRKAWEGFEVHEIEKKESSIQKCSKCKQLNTIDKPLDRRILTTLTTIIIERLTNRKPIDLFILIASNPEYKGILNLCKKYGGRMLIAGFPDDSLINFNKEDYLAFVDISKLYSTKNNLITPHPRLAASVPTIIYESSYGVSIDIRMKEEDVKSKLKEYGAEPELVALKPHRYNADKVFAILYYRSEKAASNSVSIVLVA